MYVRVLGMWASKLTNEKTYTSAMYLYIHIGVDIPYIMYVHIYKYRLPHIREGCLVSVLSCSHDVLGCQWGVTFRPDLGCFFGPGNRKKQHEGNDTYLRYAEIRCMCILTVCSRSWPPVFMRVKQIVFFSCL